MVTEQLARSSKGFLQHDPPGFLWGPKCSGYNLWQFLKAKIILEGSVSCSGKLFFSYNCSKRNSQPTLNHVQIEWKEPKIFR